MQCLGSVRIVKNCDLRLENRLGQHFQNLGHSFSLYGPPSRPITYMSFSHPVEGCDLDDGPAIQGSAPSNIYIFNMDLIQCLVVFSNGTDRNGQLGGKRSVVTLSV